MSLARIKFLGIAFGAPPQIADRPHRGDVVGCLDEQGKPVFVYPESTGYYLTWPAFISEIPNCPGSEAAHAGEALSWLSLHSVDGQVPPTRIYLNSAAADDWHNGGVTANLYHR